MLASPSLLLLSTTIFKIPMAVPGRALMLNVRGWQVSADVEFPSTKGDTGGHRTAPVSIPPPLSLSPVFTEHHHHTRLLWRVLLQSRSERGHINQIATHTDRKRKWRPTGCSKDSKATRLLPLPIWLIFSPHTVKPDVP